MLFRNDFFHYFQSTNRIVSSFVDLFVQYSKSGATWQQCRINCTQQIDPGLCWKGPWYILMFCFTFSSRNIRKCSVCVSSTSSCFVSCLAHRLSCRIVAPTLSKFCMIALFAYVECMALFRLLHTSFLLPIAKTSESPIELYFKRSTWQLLGIVQ